MKRPSLVALAILLVSPIADAESTTRSDAHDLHDVPRIQRNCKRGDTRACVRLAERLRYGRGIAGGE